MAYVITLNNGFYRIAETETDKNEHNIAYPPAVATSITDEQFQKVKKNIASVIVSSEGAISFREEPSTNTFDSQEELDVYLNQVKRVCDQFLKPSSNSSKSIYSAVNTYRSLLDSYDYSSITFPINGSWEKYCDDNSIAYVNPLQIP